jgi:hypothetical protein
MEVEAMLMRSDGGRAAPTPCGVTLTPAATGPDPVWRGFDERPIDELLLDLVCSDPELLSAEFDTIVTAEWPTPPVARLAVATAADPPDRTAGRLTLGVSKLASRPRHPGIGGWARERSPPRSRITAPMEGP